MLVCHCNRVSDAAVAEVLASGATKVGQVARTTRAGTTCGGCLPELRRMCQQAAASVMASRPCPTHAQRGQVAALSA